MITFTRCAFMAKQACATFSQVVQKITPPIANNFLKFFFALFATLALNAATAWAEEVTYTFTSKSWADSENAWTSNKDGNELTSGRGVQVPTGNSGASATSKSEFNNVSRVVVVYSTNASKGAGTIDIQIGSNSIKSYTVSKTGGTTDRNAELTFSPEESGKVKLTVNCTTNSIYVKSITIVTTASGGGETPAPGTGDELSCTWDLSKASYSAASENQVTWSSTDVNMVVDKANSTTNANNYLPTTRTSSRFYQNSILTITPEANVTITSVVFTATSDSYATALKNSAWTNATATASSKTVTVTPTNGATAISAIISANCGFTGVTVNYTKAASDEPEPVIVKILKSIAVSGMKQNFVEGDEFTFGGTCSATYSVTKNDVAQDDETVTVTPTSITGYNMSNPGEQTITVSYTEGGVTKTTTYTITVTAKPTYAITWKVNGESVSGGTTSVKEGAKVTALPTTPTFSCDNTKQFVGWTTTSINGTTDDKPAVLFTKAENAPVVTAETTYHAVFASVIGSGTATWEQTTSVAVGDQVVIAQIDDTDGKTELDGIYTSGSTSYGTGAEFDETPAGNMVFTVVAGFAEGTIAFQNGSNYLCWTSGNSLKWGATVIPSTSWACEDVTETQGVRIILRNDGDANRMLIWNESSPRFACYVDKATDNNYSRLVFYKKSGGSSYSAYQTSCATLESIALSGNYKTTFSEGDDFVFAGKVIATYDYGEPKDVTNAATLSTHNLTATGTQTVTVSYKEGDVTKTAQYTITINAAKETGTFQQYTGTLVEGDYVIYYQKDSESDGYAMKAAVSSNRLVAAVEGFTKESDIITNPDRSLVWHIAPNGSNWTIYNDKTGKYAAGTGADNKAQLLVRDDEGKILWTTSDTYEFVNVHNNEKGVNKNLRNNGTYGFACYATGTGGALSLYKYTEGVISAPTITGELEFVGSTQVSITASAGDIYYTTDGNDPTTSSNKYTAPFTINATTTVKAIAHRDGTSSSVAEKKFTKHDLLNVAQAMALDEDKVAYLNQFEVVKVIKNYGYIFIKDATGAGLIYDKDNAKGMESLVEGASVSGFIGTKDLYNRHPQLTPNVAYSDLNVTGSGAAVATEITALAEADLNKYVVLKGVTFATATNISSNPTNNGIKYRAQFGSSYQFEEGTSYDIYGFVGKYNDNLQFWFLEAAVAGSTVERYTVTYAKGEGDVQGTLPVDNDTYAAGAKVTLKDHSLTRAGYSFTGWKVTDANSNEITVTSNQFNMPAANVTATAQWQENLDFNTGYWVLVETTDQLSAGNYVVIAAAEADKAMLSYKSGDNCKATAITKNGNGKLMTFGAPAPGIFQLENGEEGTFAFRDIANTTADEYLYSTGDKNKLTSSTTNKGLFNIWVSAGVATITSTSNSRSVRYNKSDNSNLLFSCYESGQQNVALYKYMTMPTPVFSLPTGNYVGAQTITVDCAISSATIYYTTDGTTPTTSSASVAVGGSINIPTTCTLKAIAVEGTKKSEVVSATYTLVTDGVWTLVRDAAELQDGDLVVMASNSNNIVNGANTKSEYFTTAAVTFTDDKDKAAIIDFSNEALIFTLKKASNGEWLLASGSNYVDLHGDKQNALVAEPSTTWTISVDENFNATIANGSLMFRYNSSYSRFKAYTNSTGTLPRLYKLVTTYTRTVNAGEYGTICLPGKSTKTSGAIFYELAGRDTKFAYLDEVTELQAGTPYIFYATSNTLTVTYDGTTADDAKENVNGMYGTFTKIIDTKTSGSAQNILEGNYVVYNNELLLCGTGCGLYEYRAYVNVDEISTNVPAAVPGRRRVSMGVQGENTTTDFENITNGENNTIKVIENGQLFIIRNGEKYNIQGQKL